LYLSSILLRRKEDIDRRWPIEKVGRVCRKEERIEKMAGAKEVISNL
jgi:hypothetical protein